MNRLPTETSSPVDRPETRRRWIACGSLLLAASALLAACAGPFDSPDDARGAAPTATLTISTASSVNTATVRPDLPALTGLVGAFDVTMTPDLSDVSPIAVTGVTDSEISIADIPLGARWDIAVEGRDPDGTLLATGFVGDVEIATSGPISITVPIAPLQTGSGTVDVTIQWSVSAAATIDQVSVAISRLGGVGGDQSAEFTVAEPGAQTFDDFSPAPTVEAFVIAGGFGTSIGAVQMTGPLPAGSYGLTVQPLAEVGLDFVSYAPTIEVVQVYDGLESPAVISVPASALNTVPEAPSGLAAAATGSDRIELSWSDDATTETGYIVRASDDSFMTDVQFNLPAGTESFVHTPLASGTTYEYRVTAANDFGESSIATAAATTLAAFSISYFANDATGGGLEVFNQVKTAGQDVILAGNAGGLARTGFTFSGWDTQADSFGTDYAAGATYTDDADLTLYAQWTPTAQPNVFLVADSALTFGAPAQTVLAPQASFRLEATSLTPAQQTQVRFAFNAAPSQGDSAQPGEFQANLTSGSSVTVAPFTMPTGQAATVQLIQRSLTSEWSPPRVVNVLIDDYPWDNRVTPASAVQIRSAIEAGGDALVDLRPLGANSTVLTAELVVPAGSSQTIAGDGYSFVVGGANRMLNVQSSVELTLDGLVFQGGLVNGEQGSQGSNGGGGGGGAGIGGAILINDAPDSGSGSTVTLIDTRLQDNSVVGGDGGNGDGGGGNPGPGGAGGGPAGGSGGAEFDPGQTGGDFSGGGGGGGGEGAPPPFPGTNAGDGGDGGFGGGGGGGGGLFGIPQGANPGFFGTGGTYGGHGSPAPATNSSGGGGGGAGLGGSIYVGRHNTLVLGSGVEFVNNDASGGLPGTGGFNDAQPGGGNGGAVFVRNGGGIEELNGTAITDESGATYAGNSADTAGQNVFFD